MPYRGKTTLLIVAHGTSVEDGDPAGVLAHRLAPKWFGDVVPAYMRSDPALVDVLADLTAQGKTDRLLVMPLFFSAGYLVTEELPEILSRAGLHHAMVLPPVTGLGGFVPMVARHLEQALLGQGWFAHDTTLFLIAHGLKTLKEPTDEQIWLAQRIANVVPELAVRITNIEGAPSLNDWRDRADRPNRLFLPVLAGGGIHAREDVPAMLSLMPGDNGVLLDPVGVWQALPPLILEQAEQKTRRAVVLANYMMPPDGRGPKAFSP
ncbi:sirohydrochlorin chelatase [Thalassospira marina]|uniref:Cobalamin biosynthesis protein CbiX n=1 Tax=Thalassospira marina TaxID=2048283 RepID=A0A2N3KMW0_9PROT|nr:CbiX/SirB N-terminal domain-containing protein [Thalassospira marina]AUG54508.1 cobalamin biosynthesis protein CbiX [Thalassospira marina]PKR51898.1 cobalamin biosynthesis protein CbiX [Thalassospira marina]